MTDYPICSYCDVEMNIISRDRNDFVCPECFIPVPRPIRRPTKLVRPNVRRVQ